VKRRIVRIGLGGCLDFLFGDRSKPLPVSLRHAPFEPPVGALNDMRAVIQCGDEFFNAIVRHNEPFQIFSQHGRR
jgi:hypothetical protein